MKISDSRIGRVNKSQTLVGFVYDVGHYGRKDRFFMRIVNGYVSLSTGEVISKHDFPEDLTPVDAEVIIK